VFAAAVLCVAGTAGSAHAQRFQKLDGLDNFTEHPYDIQQTRDGGYVVVGEVQRDNDPTTGDMYIARHARDGTLLWVTRYGTPDSRDAAYSVHQTANGAFIVAGHTDDGPLGLVLLRLTPGGAPVWSNVYRADVFGEIDQPFVERSRPQAAVREAGNGDIIAVANTRTPQGGQVGVYLRTTGAGGLITNLAYPNSVYGPFSFDAFADLKEDRDGTILITGFTTDVVQTPTGLLTADNADILTLRIAPPGGVIWAYRSGDPDPAVNEVGRGLDNLPLADIAVGAATDQGTGLPTDFGTFHLWTDATGGTLFATAHISQNTLPAHSATSLSVNAELFTAGRDWGLPSAGLAGRATMLRLPPAVPALIETWKYGPITDQGAEGLAIMDLTCGVALTGPEAPPSGALEDQWVAKTNDLFTTGCFEERLTAKERKPALKQQPMFFTLNFDDQVRPFGTNLGYQMAPFFLCLDCFCNPCPIDLNADCTIDSGDLSAFIVAFLASAPLADITGDGVVDSGDLALFITLFLAGCV
jgi:hypothetical protein